MIEEAELCRKLLPAFKSGSMSTEAHFSLCWDLRSTPIITSCKLILFELNWSLSWLLSKRWSWLFLNKIDLISGIHTVVVIVRILLGQRGVSWLFIINSGFIHLKIREFHWVEVLRLWSKFVFRWSVYAGIVVCYFSGGVLHDHEVTVLISLIA